MLLTCKCLNVSITIEGSEIQPVDFDKLGLSNLELHDAFFKDSVGTVQLGEINKEQACLVNIRHVGDWLIHQCLNCDMHTHAIHRDRRGDCVIVNQKLISDGDQISTLKSSDAFSEVFKIITNHGDVTSNDVSAIKVTGPMQGGALALQQQLADAMRQQSALVEEKIRAFSEQQYTELENFRKTAHEDQRSLLKLLQRWSEVLQKEEQPQVVTARPPTAPVKLNSMVPTLSSITRPAALSKQGPPAKSKKSQTATVPGNQYSPFERTSNVNSGRARQSRNPGRRELGDQGSLDTEGLFDLEGMEEAGNDQEHFHSEDETDDTDESGSHDEGIHIPRHRSASQLAKSLPVNVPAFHLANSAGSAVIPPMDFDSKDYPEERMDIAASIKALAQSVHGGASVFGDLPRPRFSTQL